MVVKEDLFWWLVIKEDRVEFFGITSQYEKKSDQIKRVYFPIAEWEKAGLKSNHGLT